MGNMLGAMAMQPLIGVLLDQRWGGAMQSGARSYDFAAYSGAFTLMLVWLLAGLAALACTRETNAKQSA